MDPFSLSTGVVSLVALVLKLVVGALGMIDKTVAAYDEAADELKGLQKELEQLQAQMVRIHGALTVLASNTKDPGFKKLLRDEKGQVAVRDLCDALEETFNTLTQMTDKANSDDSRPAPLPSNKKYLEFTQAVLRHSFMPSKIAGLVKALREMRSDVQICLTKLETTFHHVHTLYDIMNNGLARIVSRTSIFSTSTNLTIRKNLSDWLKRREKTWGLFGRHNTTPLNEFLQSDSSIGTPRITTDLLAETFYQPSDDSDTPPPPVPTDIAGRRRVADLIRRAGTLLDPDPERYNNSVYSEGRYRTYPRTPGEALLGPRPRHDPDDPYDAPPPPETTDIAGRRRVAGLIRRAGALPDPERYSDRVYSEGRYRTYPRTPGEDLDPKLAEEEHNIYLTREGPSRSQIDLVTPGGPDGTDSHTGASASGSQTTRRPDMQHRARTGSSDSQILEDPGLFPPTAAIVTNPTDTEQQPSSRPSSG